MSCEFDSHLLRQITMKYPPHDFEDWLLMNPIDTDIKVNIKNGEFFGTHVTKELRKNSPAPTPQKIETTKDYVNEPDHYQIFPDMQVIDVIRKTLTEEEFRGFCKGNILKYRLRDKQDQKEDYEKAKKYKNYLSNT